MDTQELEVVGFIEEGGWDYWQKTFVLRGVDGYYIAEAFGTFGTRGASEMRDSTHHDAYSVIGPRNSSSAKAIVYSSYKDLVDQSDVENLLAKITPFDGVK